MKVLCKKYETLIRQEYPESLNEIKGEDRFKALTDFAVEHNLFIHASEPKFDGNTVEYCEKVFEQGYSVIINDGQLIGFKKEEAL